MDKASPHYTCKKVIKYFEDNKDTLNPVYLPTPHHLNLWYCMENVWNIAKRDLLIPKVLYIIWRFKGQDIWIFQDKKIES